MLKKPSKCTQYLYSTDSQFDEKAKEEIFLMWPRSQQATKDNF